jgi:hypothetical protein
MIFLSVFYHQTGRLESGYDQARSPMATLRPMGAVMQAARWMAILQDPKNREYGEMVIHLRSALARTA